jgi:hypothetical protein
VKKEDFNDAKKQLEALMGNVKIEPKPQQQQQQPQQQPQQQQQQQPAKTNDHKIFDAAPQPKLGLELSLDPIAPIQLSASTK